MHWREEPVGEGFRETKLRAGVGTRRSFSPLRRGTVFGRNGGEEKHLEDAIELSRGEFGGFVELEDGGKIDKVSFGEVVGSMAFVGSGEGLDVDGVLTRRE